MHTRLSGDNPYGHSRHGFAWEQVPAGTTAHLDFGCHNGAFLSSLTSKNIKRLVGVDVSEEAVKKGKRLFPELEIIKIGEGSSVPFDDGFFSSITVLDVLEHVYEQGELLAELNRVLEDGGKLVVMAPGRHVFSFLDTGNLKFIFPRLHRWYYSFRHSPEEYEHRYASNPDGLVGDISAKKRWHEHFCKDKLRTLLREKGFNVIDFDGTGFFSRPIIFLNLFLLQRFELLQPAIRRILALDASFFERTNLFCVAQKCVATKRG
jgi:SAM-dependent methyltransferase